MKSSILSLASLTFLASRLVAGQEFFEILTIYPDNTCNPSGDSHTMESPAEMPGCTYGTFIPNSPPWDTNGDIVTFYVDPSSAPEGCTVVFWAPNFDSDVQCSVPQSKFSSGQSGCIETSANMNAFNYGWCCGSNCEQYIPSLAARDSDLVSPIRDVTAIKRSAPFSMSRKENQELERRQIEVDGCAFNSSSERTLRSFTPQAVTPVALCNSEAGCKISSTYTVSFSYSQTFEVGAEVGASILEVVQASVSFSYSETYGEETSAGVAVDVTVPQGQQGAIYFTPLYECYEGSFSGSNCRATTDSQGRVCVPKRLVSGLADGVVSFVLEASP